MTSPPPLPPPFPPIYQPVSKVIAEPAVADPQQSPPRVSPPLPAQPVQPAPPTPLSIVVETKSEEARRDDVTTRRKSQVSNNNPEKRRSKTEKQLVGVVVMWVWLCGCGYSAYLKLFIIALQQACNVSWRMSMRALAGEVLRKGVWVKFGWEVLSSELHTNVSVLECKVVTLFIQCRQGPGYWFYPL